MFEKRTSLSYRYDDALDVLDGKDEVIQLLLNKSIIRQNGTFLELDDQFLSFFEEILEINEIINTSYINESIRKVKDEYMIYYLQSNTDSDKYRYLKAVKSALQKIGRTTLRNISDLNRNIDNAFKTEPNYKIKLLKLENYKEKLFAIQQMIEQTEKLLEEELTFFKTATDEELKHIRTQLSLDLTEARQNLIETRKQIIEYINQIKYQSKFIEKLKQIKYLRDQFEIRHKTDIAEVLSNACFVGFETKPVYPLKLSLDYLQLDEVYPIIKKVRNSYQSKISPLKQTAADLSADDIEQQAEREIIIDLQEVRNGLKASGKHLFDYMMEYRFPRDVPFGERVTLYCQIISLFEDELEISDEFARHSGVEYAIVHPKLKTNA
jgi:predicted DNA-binding transcriptional regulator AlpA